VTCTGKIGPHVEGAENCGPPRKLRPIFRISLTALRCAVSSEAQMTANPLLRRGCETDWQQLGRIEKPLRVVG